MLYPLSYGRVCRERHGTSVPAAGSRAVGQTRAVMDARELTRYVALGDSSTEGLDDPDGAGGYRGWADRLAVEVSRSSPDLLYANLAVRGRLVRQVRDEQLAEALALRPDLATVFAGVNDLLRPTVDLAAVVGDLEEVYGALRDAGATVLTITVPDPSRVMPVARRLAPRIGAYNAAVRLAAERTGVLLVDVGSSHVAGDPRLWSEDRLHANSLGHERIAAALAHGLGLPGTDDSWSRPLDAPDPRSWRQAALAEARWARTHLAPWLLRRARGRSSGDGVVPKRPQLAPWS